MRESGGERGSGGKMERIEIGDQVRQEEGSEGRKKGRVEGRKEGKKARMNEGRKEGTLRERIKEKEWLAAGVKEI